MTCSACRRSGDIDFLWQHPAVGAPPTIEVLCQKSGGNEMQQHLLRGKRVAIVATDGFEQLELTEPKRALEEAGAIVDVVSINPGKIQGMNHMDQGDRIKVDKTIDQANPRDYDNLVLPGGVANPDRLRTDKKVVAFVKSFFDAGKPVAAICHGPWTLIEAGAVNGRTLTSWPSLQTDLRNAGANWVDEEVVVDQGLITSRNPDDIPKFNEQMIKEFATSQVWKVAS
jgi:protease I